MSVHKNNLLSKQDVISLLELIHDSISCAKEEDLRELINKLRRLIPYDFAVCGTGKVSDGGAADSYNIINVSYPSEWLELYVLQGFAKIDPVVKENCANFRLQYWGDTYEKYDSSGLFVSKAEDFGLSTGYTHGLRNFEGSEGSLFSFAGPSIEHHPRTEAILRHLVPHLHQALVRITGMDKKKPDPILSLREKEVLNWIKQGKSTWDISVILGISRSTVNFHVNNVLQKLDAVSRAQAVAIAIEQGLIDIE